MRGFDIKVPVIAYKTWNIVCLRNDEEDIEWEMRFEKDLKGKEICSA